MNISLKTIKASTLLLFVFVFLLSLTQPAIIYKDFDGVKTHPSLDLLLFGGLAFLGGGFYESAIWMANPLSIIAIFLFLTNNKNAIVLSSTSAIIALSYAAHDKILAAENGRMAYIQTLTYGYWLWLFSFIVLSAGVIYYFKKQDNTNIQ